ncbi:MAG: hypothetical protein ACREEB_11350 [Caulobacteraceae bacterium]
MDEIEQRLAAIELVLIELIPWLDPGAIEDAAASIRAGLTAQVCGDERTIRLQAISIIEEGRQRFAAHTLAPRTTGHIS